MAEAPKVHYWFELQTWDGQGYHPNEICDDYDQIHKAYEQHKRVMPNCPCRVVSHCVTDVYRPGGRG